MTKNRFFRVLKKLVLRGLYYGEKLPFYFRLPLGILLCIGGVLGFLPVLGFWMLPLGVAFILLCIPVADRWVQRWMERTQEELEREQSEEEVGDSNRSTTDSSNSRLSD